MSGDLSLAIEIRDFEIESAGQGAEAVVDVYVKLIDERHNSVLTTRRFQSRTPTVSQDVPAEVHALNEAFQRVVTEIVAWASHRTA